MTYAVDVSDQTTERTDLTPAQRGIWYAQQLDAANATYQIGQYLEFDGRIDIRLLSIAWTKTVRDIDALCLRFAADGDGPFAVLERPEPTDDLLTVVDLRSMHPDEARRSAEDHMAADLATPREIDSAELSAAVVFRLPGGRTLLFQRVHHIMLDGYSAVIALHYLARVYSELRRRVPAGIARGRLGARIARAAAQTASPFPTHQDLLADLETYRLSSQHTEDEAFWRRAVRGDTAVEGLEGAPEGPAREVVRVRMPLPEPEAAPLRDLGRDVPRTLVGVFGMYLARITGQDEVGVGLPVTARRGRTAKSTPSMLSNILPLRLDVSAGSSVEETLRRAGETVRGAVRHQRFRVEDLPESPAMAGPSVNFLPVIEDLSFGAVAGRVHILSTGPVHDMSLVLSGLDSSAAEPTLQLEGDAALHTAETLREHGHRLRRYIAQALESPSAGIEELQLTTEEETARLLDHGTGARESIEPLSVLESFAAAAAAQPEETAVVAEDGTMSFGRLEEDSTRLAHYLAKHGAGPGTAVAVRLERSVRLPMLVLAVLKAGSAYVPLDPEYPVERVAGMIEDAEPALLLTSGAQAAADRAAGASWQVRTVAVDADTDKGWHQCSADPRTLPAASQHDLAYVVFTSGSTGRPKGVGVDRIALRNLFQEHRDRLFEPARDRLGRRVRVAHTAGLSFDAAWDPLLWLFAGHQLHIVDDDARRDPQELSALLTRSRIDVIETTPSFAEALLGTGIFGTAQQGAREDTDEDMGEEPDARFPSIVAVGGEEVRRDLWDRLAGLTGVHAINLYGPTETTVDSLVTPITAGTRPHIGSSVRNSRHYVLDSALQPVPEAAVGELYLAGINVARGYVGQPGMSAARFIADPFADDGSRMYRTGDVVRRRRDGSLRFMGRIDDQVKIRGYRVELSEVETALSALPGVDRAAAVVHGEGPSVRLTGYVTRRSGAAEETGDAGNADAAVDGHRLREDLRQHLPAYMVPGAVLVLDEFPLTANGKLDRKALPQPQAQTADAAQRPRTAFESELSVAFAEVLGLPPEGLGIDEDFFAAGGHSLLATRLAARLGEQLGASVRVRDIFECPTVASLAARLRDSGSDVGEMLRPRTRPEVLPLSLTQRRLWFLAQLEPDSAAYNIPVVLTVAGAIDTAALRSAMHDVVARHEPLRTVFPAREGEPEQLVLGEDEGRPRFTAVSVPAERLDAVVASEATRPFDITTETPLRAVLLSTSPQQHTLLVVMHHIASDGWSLAPFARDLSEAYAARLQDRAPERETLPVSYADFSLWQREHLGESSDPQSEAHRQAAFWTQRLQGVPEEIALPRDRARGALTAEGGPSGDPASEAEAEAEAEAGAADRPAAHTGVGQLEHELGAQAHARLRERASAHGASLFMVLHTALAAALKQHGAGEDIVIGTPVAGRDDPQLDELVGFFVNTVALRTALDQDPQLSELIERVRESDLSAYAHQDLPFDAVVDALSPPRTPDMHPVFQVMLTLQNTEPAVVKLAGADVTVPAQMTSAGVKTDLMVDVEAPAGDDGPLRLRIGYDRELFEAGTVEAMLGSLVRVLDALLEDPGQRLSDLPAVDAGTAAWLEEQSRGAEAPVSGTVLDALAETARRHPEAEAVVDEKTALTYRQLTDAVDRGAARLATAGVGRGDRVLIALPRSVDALVGVFASLRAGAVAVPVDVAYPAARIGQIVAGAQPRVAIVCRAGLSDGLQDALTSTDEPVQLLDPADLRDGDPDAAPERQGSRTAQTPPPPEADDIAYLVHTSGTTGTPKAVQVSHRALQNVLAHHVEQLIEPHQHACAPELPRMLHLTGLGFDAAWDPLLWLAGGTTVRIPAEHERVDAERIAALLGTGDVDVVETTPSYVQQLLAVGLADTLESSGARLTVALGGEPVPSGLWRTLAGHPRLDGWNLYGPSEFTVDSVVTPITGTTPHIGRPIGNVTARVLDSALGVVPPGVEGELYLSGLSQADGYRGRPAETSLRFVCDPWDAGARMYRTGDMVRRRADGTLEFLRRDDAQVKIRGHRIELAEVESVLGALDGVDSAVVRVLTPGGPDTAQLTAWVVTSRETGPLRAEAARLLPEYMVPARVVTLPEIPLTAHGKVDDAALPAPRTDTGSAPASAAEEAVCRIMAGVLGLHRVGPDDDFFALGGHSLLAVSLMSGLQRELGIDLPLRAIFDGATPRGLLGLAEQHGGSPEDGSPGAGSPRAGSPGAADSSADADPRRQILERPLSAWVRENPRDPGLPLPLTAGQQRLWFLNRLDPGSAEYTVVLKVALEGDLDAEAMAAAVDDLIARHEILRTSYPVEPNATHAPDAQPVQHVHAPVPGILGTEPLDVTAGFDLTTETPVRAALVPLGASSWRLELAIHHIATDGASLAPLVRDLGAAYAARACGGTALRRALRVQFGDVARREQRASAVQAEHGMTADPALERWSERLSGVPEQLSLPGAGQRADSAHQPAEQHSFEIPAQLAERLTQIAAARSASAFHGWLAGLAGYLRRTGAGDDVVLGSPSAGRRDPDVQDLIGFFVNTLPLRLPLADESLSLFDAVDIARRRTLDAIEDEHVPFEQIVDRVAPERQLGRHPLFQTMLSLEEPGDAALDLPGVTATPLDPGSTGSAKMDLSFTLRPRADSSGAVDGVLEYNSAAFTADSARRLVDGWMTFLAEVTGSPELPLLEAPMRGTASALEPLTASSDARDTGSLEQTLAQTVRRSGDRTALVAEDRSLTFTELDQRIDLLARGLRARGLGRGDVVALCLPRSADTVAALLAVWRAGAVALPIDVSLPHQRVAEMLTASAARLLVHGDDGAHSDDASHSDNAAHGEAGTSTGLARSAASAAGLDDLPLTGTRALLGSAGHDGTGTTDPLPDAGPAQRAAVLPEDPAYLLFTSGTTGKPKGVQVPHRALDALLDSHRHSVIPDPEREPRRMAHTTGVGFDAAMDPVLWLVAGHQVHIVDDETRRNPQALTELFAERGIGAWETTPGYVSALSAHPGFADLLGARPAEDPFVLLLGGEPVDPGLWTWLRELDGVRAWNLYGPTEAGVDSLIAGLATQDRPDLGAPTASMRAYVLDERLRPAPDGTAGELWLAGPQLAHGYLGRPAATASAFVPDPFAADGSRMYRTGDLVLVDPTEEAPAAGRAPGEPASGPAAARPRVRMLGRADSQVKIRGYRVEPGEVEALLRAAPGVAEAVVRPRTGARGTELVGWVVREGDREDPRAGDAGGTSASSTKGHGAGPTEGSGEEFSEEFTAGLRRELATRVPGYMVPAAVLCVDRIPLTPNGKVDDAALPDVAPHAAGTAGRSPSTAAERAVTRAFGEVLGKEGITAEDSFFDLGGHSFLAQPTIAAVNAELGSDLPVQAIFQAPTVEALAALAASDGGDVAESLRPVLPLRREGRGEPIFAIHPGSGLSWAFSTLLPHLETTRPVLGLQMHGIAPDEDPADEPATLRELIARYVDTIREEQPEGPYHLLGWSFGGRLAQAIAAELQTRGHEVRSLTVLDSYPSVDSTSGMEGEQDFWRAFLSNQGLQPDADQELGPRQIRELLERAGSPLASVPEESMARIMRRFRTIGALLDSAEVPHADVGMHLLEATRDVPSGRPSPESWLPHIGGRLMVEQVPVAHEHMLAAEASPAVAAAINAWGIL